MDNTFNLKQIGKVAAKEVYFEVQLNKEYSDALTNIEGFSHLQVIWWGDHYDKDEYRSITTTDKPYKKGPDKIGIFGTRSPVRPNPLLMTTIQVIEIDTKKGIIRTPYIDAENDTPVLDIKAYHKSERIKECKVPEWCEHWPEWYEDSAVFDWEAEFNF